MLELEIIAEISGNHSGEISNAFQLIDDAKRAGATAVKFQHYDWSTLATQRAKNPRIRAMGCTENDLRALYHKHMTPDHWFPDLASYANDAGIPWFSSAFSPADVALLVKFGCPRIKISAFEYQDRELLLSAMGTGLPLVISIPQEGNPYKFIQDWFAKSPEAIILLATDYANYKDPFNYESLHFHDVFDGISDHTPDADFAIAAVAAAAARGDGLLMIERHLSLPNIKTADEEFSFDPMLFALMVKKLRNIAKIDFGPVK